MSTNEINIQITADHLSNISSTKPINALFELIWNSIDADATEIKILFNKSDLDNLLSVTVIDNGTGINYDRLNKLFGKVGESWKKENPKLHGSKGQGRLKVLSIGKNIKWDTTYKGEKNSLYNYSISTEKDRPETYLVSAPSKETRISYTGTKCTITNIEKESSILIYSQSKKSIIEQFSPHMLHGKIKIFYDGELLDPELNIKTRSQILKTSIKEDLEIEYEIIVWNSDIRPIIFYGGINDNYYLNISKNARNGIHFSCYVRSNFFSILNDENKLHLTEMNPDFALIENHIEFELKNFILEVSKMNVKEAIDKLKESKVYPHFDIPSTRTDEITQQVFDVCAAQILEYAPKFPDSDKKQQKMTLRLVKEALETNPSSIQNILTEILDLNEDDQKKFSELIDDLGLKSIISLSGIINHRLKFLDSFAYLVGDKVQKKHLKERAQLHKILEEESWIFGDTWHMSTSDKSLKKVLLKHIELVKRQDLIPEIEDYEDLSLKRIPDMMFSKTKVSNFNFGEYRHLIIELKRPNSPLTKEELRQIEDYADAIANNNYFTIENTTYTFWIINTELSQEVKNRFHDDKDPNLVTTLRNGKCKIYAYTWGQIINSCKQKLHFLKQEISNNSEDIDDEYISKQYPELFNKNPS